MENDGKLRKREYTLLLKHNMSNISKMEWWMPLISSYPNADSKGHYDAHSKYWDCDSVCVLVSEC